MILEYQGADAGAAAAARKAFVVSAFLASIGKGCTCLAAANSGLGIDHG
jgi:hypothetical protein